MGESSGHLRPIRFDNRPASRRSIRALLRMAPLGEGENMTDFVVTPSSAVNVRVTVVRGARAEIRDAYYARPVCAAQRPSTTCGKLRFVKVCEEGTAFATAQDGRR